MQRIFDREKAAECLLDLLGLRSIKSLQECNREWQKVLHPLYDAYYSKVTALASLSLPELKSAIDAAIKASSEPSDNSILLNIAHRGGGSRDNVEPNTLKAFDQAIENGANVIELDVQVCRTGEIILFHDLYLPYNSELITELSYSTIRRLLPTITTLQQMLDHVPASMIIFFDLKGSNIVQPLWQVLTQYVLGRHWSASNFIIGCFNQRHLHQLNVIRQQCCHREALKGIQTAVILDGCPPPTFADKLQVDYVSTTYGTCNAEFLADLKVRNLKLIIWTVNTRSLMIRVLKMGVAGIVTDYPRDLAIVSRAHTSNPPGVINVNPVPNHEVNYFHTKVSLRQAYFLSLYPPVVLKIRQLFLNLRDTNKQFKVEMQRYLNTRQFVRNDNHPGDSVFHNALVIEQRTRTMENNFAVLFDFEHDWITKTFSKN